MFLLAAEWFGKWSEYVNFSRQMSTEEKSKQAGSHPGSIDNSSILDKET